MGNNWGGPWTEIKLDVLKRYLQFYTTALKNQKFTRIYIDAFAGNGQCEIRDGSGGTRVIEGSAKIALDNDPAFSKLIFIEGDNIRHGQLSEFCKIYEDQLPIEIFESEANTKIKEICATTYWKRHRAVMFLDPYGMEAEWSTIEAIARTKAVDLWYLFPLSGFYRNLPIKQKDQDASKVASLNRLLGTDEWASFYSPDCQYNLGLFEDEGTEPDNTREPGWQDLKAFVHKRLEGIFEEVSEPLLLPRPPGPPQFALFCAVSNKGAISAGGMRAAGWILKHA